MTQLIVFRVVQGLGTGGVGAGAFALIGSLIPPRERGRYQGMIASVMAADSIGGPLLGGVVTEYLGWRWVFYINLPIGILALVWCQVSLRLPHERGKGRIDWPGITLLTVTISCFVLAANLAGTTFAWGSWQVIGLVAVSIAAFVAFVAVERRAEEPLLPLRILACHRNFPLSMALVMVAGVTLFGATLYLPQFQQIVQGASVTGSGILLLPMMIPVVVVSQIVGKIMTETGRYKIFPVLGTAVMAAGLFLLSTMDAATSFPATACYMAVLGIGIGGMMQMPTTIAQNSVEMRDMGVASSSVALFRSIGGSLGLAVFGSLFTAAVAGHVPVGFGGAPDPDRLAALPATARIPYLDAVATGTHVIFLTAAAVAVAVFMAALFIEEVPLRSSRPKKESTNDEKTTTRA